MDVHAIRLIAGEEVTRFDGPVGTDGGLLCGEETSAAGTMTKTARAMTANAMTTPIAMRLPRRLGRDAGAELSRLRSSVMAVSFVTVA